MVPGGTLTSKMETAAAPGQTDRGRCTDWLTSDGEHAPPRRRSRDRSVPHVSRRRSVPAGLVALLLIGLCFGREALLVALTATVVLWAVASAEPL